MTRPFSGLFLTAVGQSVGAGCCAAGTPSIQIRHMPFGGRAAAGIVLALSLGDFERCALAGAATPLKSPRISKALNPFIDPPTVARGSSDSVWGGRVGATRNHHYISRN